MHIAIQNQEVGLTQSPLKWLLLPWVPKCVKLCMLPLTGESSPQPSDSPESKPSWLSKPDVPGLSFQCRMPGLGSLTWGSIPASWGGLQQLSFSSPLWVDHPGVVGLNCTISPSFHLSHCGSSFIFLVAEDMFFARLLVFLINSCSANSCNFGVLIGGGELRVF